VLGDIVVFLKFVRDSGLGMMMMLGTGIGLIVFMALLWLAPKRTKEAVHSGLVMLGGIGPKLEKILTLIEEEHERGEATRKDILLINGHIEAIGVKLDQIEKRMESDRDSTQRELEAHDKRAIESGTVTRELISRVNDRIDQALLVR
jgi:hypothetical protein